MEVVDEVPKSEWQSWEIAYIQFYHDEGCDLTNGTFGGDGWYPTDETRRRMSECKLGEKNPMFGKLPWSTGKRYSNPKKREHMIKTGGPMKGKFGELHPNFGKPSWNRGKKASHEAIQNQRAAHLGKKLTPEAIAKRTETRRLNGWNKKARTPNE